MAEEIRNEPIIVFNHNFVGIGTTDRLKEQCFSIDRLVPGHVKILRTAVKAPEPMSKFTLERPEFGSASNEQDANLCRTGHGSHKNPDHNHRAGRQDECVEKYEPPDIDKTKPTETDTGTRDSQEAGDHGGSNNKGKGGQIVAVVQALGVADAQQQPGKNGCGNPDPVAVMR